MSIRIVKWQVVGFALSFFIFVLSACTPSYEMRPIELRDFPAEASDSLFPGDTREKVYSVLGEPLIDASKLGVQVFQHSAPSGVYGAGGPAGSRSLQLPKDVYVFSLVTYDENKLVKDFEMILWGYSSFPWKDYIYLDGFSFFGIGRGSMPQTLLGPSISSKELVETAAPEKGCTLIVLFSECSMAKISLDKVRIIDLGWTPYYCRPGLDQSERREHNYYGTYIKKEIYEGVHKIEMSKGRWDKKFESNFECEHGETIFAEFKAHGCEKVPWHGIEPVGAISIYRPSSDSIIEGDTLWPILWHGGVWYGPPGILREK